MFSARLVGIVLAGTALLSVAACTIDTSTGSLRGRGGTASNAVDKSTVPDVVGQRLSTAESALNAAGYHAIRPLDDTGRDRIVIDPQNRVVDGQSPSAGAPASAKTTVTLMVRRPSDTGRPTQVTKGMVPNVLCMNLQDAQNTLQSAGFFNLASIDGLGQGRVQILDRDWVVTKQSVRAGSHPAALTRIVLTAVKYGEPTGASGCPN